MTGLTILEVALLFNFLEFIRGPGYPLLEEGETDTILIEYVYWHKEKNNEARRARLGSQGPPTEADTLEGPERPAPGAGSDQVPGAEAPEDTAGSQA